MAWAAVPAAFAAEAGASSVTVTTLVAPVYEEARTFGTDENGAPTLAAVRQDGKWGYIDAGGKMVIQPQYDYAGAFREGLAIVSRRAGNVYGLYLVDRRGGETPIRSYTGAVMAVSDPSGISDAWGCYDGVVYIHSLPVGLDGQPIYSDDWDLNLYYANGPAPSSYMTGPCVDGVIPMATSGLLKNRYNRESGEWEVDWNNQIPVVVNFYMDKTGRVIKSFEPTEMGTGKAGLIEVYAPDESGLAVAMYGTINEAWTWGSARLGALKADGSWAVEPAYNQTRCLTGGTYFSEGVWTVRRGEKWGAVDPTGREIIPAQYEAMLTFGNDLAPVRENGTWHYVDKQHNSYQIGAPEGGAATNIVAASNFNNNIATVYDGIRAYCVANTPVNGVLPAVKGTEDLALSAYFPDYTGSGELGTVNLVGGIVTVEKDGKWGYLKLEFHLTDLNPFEDVHLGDWFYDAVQFAVKHGLMNGTAADQFSPGGVSTRGQLMTILAREAGVETSGSVPWYQKGLDWAVSHKVSDGTNPDRAITREELAVMLYRYADPPAAGTSGLDSYADAGRVSSWARDAMAWAVANGVVTGFTDNTLRPQATATRAQMAVMLQRFIEKGLAPING